MVLTPDLFRIDYPQFVDDDAYPNTTVQRFLDRAAAQMDEAKWGNYFDDGQGALAAHLMASTYGSADTGGATTGALSGITIPGEIAITYAAPTRFEAGSLTSTKYGQEYVRLGRLAIGTAARFISN